MADYQTPKIKLNTAGAPRAKCLAAECGFVLGLQTRASRVWGLIDIHLTNNPDHNLVTDRPMPYYKNLHDLHAPERADREPALWPREAIEKAQVGEEAREPSESTGGQNPWLGDEGETRGATALEQWWRANTENEIAWLVPKAEEYGGVHRASDLTDLGRTMVDLQGTGDEPWTDAQLQAMAIFFYIEGKMGRWKAAILEGRDVSDDTLTDISVYARMALRARQAGGWPV